MTLRKLLRNVKLEGDKTMKNVILIARVSDVEQRKALPAQKLRLEKYAEQELSLSKKQYVYQEFDESAYKEDRQKFSQLISQLNGIDGSIVLVFDKIDRFTRDASQKEVQFVSKLVKEGKVELHFPSDNLFITEYSPATDLFRLGIGMLLAKYYSDSSRDNVKRRFEQMRNDGIWTHKAPVGYKNVNLGTEKKPVKEIVVDPKYSHHVIKAFELRAEGTPYGVIAKILADDGFRSVRSGKKPSKGYIEKILSNKFYYGIMEHDDKEYPHKYEPLISRSLYNQCEAIREKRRHEKTKYDSIDYIFKKIVKCGRCGKSVSPFKSRNTVYLRCANSTNCKNPNTAESLLLPGVIDTIKGIEIPKDYIPLVIDELKARHDDQQSYYTQSVQNLRDEYDSIKDRIAKNYDYLLSGSITQDLHDETAKRLESRQQELNEQLKLLTSDNKDFVITASYLLDLAQRASELFEQGTNAQKQRILEYVLSNIVLTDKKLSYELSDPYKTISEAKKKSLVGSQTQNWCKYRYFP